MGPFMIVFHTSLLTLLVDRTNTMEKHLELACSGSKLIKSTTKTITGIQFYIRVPVMQTYTLKSNKQNSNAKTEDIKTDASHTHTHTH